MRPPWKVDGVDERGWNRIVRGDKFIASVEELDSAKVMVRMLNANGVNEILRILYEAIPDGDTQVVTFEETD